MKTCAAIFRLQLVLSAIFFLTGCALLDIPPNLKARISKDIRFQDVLRDAEAFKGRTVMWGGQIVKVTHAKDGSYAEILQIPLTWEGSPTYSDASEGRYLVVFKQYLDAEVYRPRRKVTIVGEVLGRTDKPIQDDSVEYSYPLISGEYIRLWPRTYRRRCYSTWDSNPRRYYYWEPLYEDE
ncbi:MAG: hypothetical protein A2X46_16310 [Lentisphaerae bacterium GWF2_57_35]|nr:MAG: hypothetical protein A2X46_16310 [Lentisphaerae bacterium GWF2_57_35]